MAAEWQKRLTFITVEQEAPLILNGYRIPEDLDLPIFTEALSHIKGEEVPWLDFINGTLYLLANDPENPRKKDYNRLLLAFDPNIVQNLLHQSAEAAQEGKLYMAIDLLHALIAIAPDLPEAHFNLGLALQTLAREQGEKEDYQRLDLYLRRATAAFEQSVALRGNFPYAYYFLGFLYEYLDEKEEAKQAWERSLSLGIQADLAAEVEERLRELVAMKN